MRSGSSLLLIISLYFVVFPSYIMSAELFVSPNGKGELCSKAFPCSIETAIYKAKTNQEKDIINILPGVYEIISPIIYNPEGTVADASITIQGTDIKKKPILRGSDAGTCILKIDTTGYPSKNSPDDSNITVEIKGLIFENGKCNNGGAININSVKAKISISECMFRDNSADQYGGGIYIEGGSEISIFNNIIYNNSALEGGGIYIEESNQIYIEESNQSFSMYIYNNTIYNNNATQGNGGGVYIKNSLYLSHMYIFNNVIYDNISNIKEGEDLYIIANAQGFNIINNNFSANAKTRNVDGNGKIVYTVKSEDVYVKALYSVLLMENNTKYPPSFINPSKGNFKLACGSRLVDAGTSGSWMKANTDFFGEIRIDGANIDIGADEVNLVGSVYTESESINFGDVDVTLDKEINGKNLIEFKIYNDGCVDLEITKIELTDNKENVFKIKEENCTSKKVKPGGNDFCTINIFFKPILDTKYGTKLVLHFNNPYESPKTLNITGQGTVPPNLKKPIIIADPNAHDFGSLYLGQYKKVKITVKNAGYEKTSRIESVSLDNAEDFSIVYDSCKYAIIQPLKTCEVEIGFNPKSAGVKSTRLIFNGEITVANLYGLALERKKGNCSSTHGLTNYLSLLFIYILLVKNLKKLMRNLNL